MTNGPADASLPLGLLAARLTSLVEADLFAQLQASGFPDLRPRHSALLTSLEPEGARLTVLADRANVSPQAMGELVDDLERRGYLQRAPDPTDRRARLIRFTERGQHALDECLAIAARIEAKQVEIVGPARYASARSVLEELIGGYALE